MSCMSCPLTHRVNAAGQLRRFLPPRGRLNIISSAMSDESDEGDDELCLEENQEVDGSDEDGPMLEDNTDARVPVDEDTGVVSALDDDDDDLLLEDNTDTPEVSLGGLGDARSTKPDQEVTLEPPQEENGGHDPTPTQIDSWQTVQLALGEAPSSSALGLWRARRSLAATIAHALSELPPGQRLEDAAGGRGRDGRWLLWIVGAREALEGELSRQGLLVEVLDRLCPRREGWELALIGPEMLTWEFPSRDGKGLVRAYTNTLHAFCKEQPDETPNAAVLFNSGVGTLLYPLVDQWLPSLAQLLKLDIPLLSTCFNLRELEGERVILDQVFEARALTNVRSNPFASPTPVGALEAGRMTETAAAQLIDQLLEENEQAVAAHRAKEEDQSDGGDQVARAKREAAAPHSVSNLWYKWRCGSTLSIAEREIELIKKAKDMVRTCAKIFALKEMETWLEFLQGSSAEQVACYAMLVADATAESSIALIASSKGAVKVLQQTHQRWQSQVSDEPSNSSNGQLSYTGTPPSQHILGACIRALQHIASASQAVLEVSRIPDEPLQELEHPMAFENVFQGQFVNLRQAPSVSATIVSTLPRGALCNATAKRGAWVRVSSPPDSDAWALLSHPLHGQLLRQHGP